MKLFFLGSDFDLDMSVLKLETCQPTVRPLSVGVTDLKQLERHSQWGWMACRVRAACLWSRPVGGTWEWEESRSGLSLNPKPKAQSSLFFVRIAGVGCTPSLKVS